MYASAEQLAALQVGDEVTIFGGGIYSRDRIEKISKITKTQIVVGNARFRRTTGLEIGKDHYGEHIALTTDKDRLKVRKRRVVDKLLKHWDEKKLSTYPVETLEQVLELLGGA